MMRIRNTVIEYRLTLALLLIVVRVSEGRRVAFLSGGGGVRTRVTGAAGWWGGGELWPWVVLS